MQLNFLASAMSTPSRWLSGATLAVALAACGGGGGSPGETFPAVTPEVGSITLTASANTMTGTAASSVVLTALVKDKGNNAQPDVTVNFSASSGVISNTVRKSNFQGLVSESLSLGGDLTARTITVTASAGGRTSAPVTITVTAP